MGRILALRFATGVLLASAVLLAAALGAPAPAGGPPAGIVWMDRLGAGALRPEPVDVVWLGLPPSPRDAAWIRRSVETTFGFRVRFAGLRPLPPGAFLPGTGRWDAGAILDDLADRMRLDAVRVLGVTFADLAGDRGGWAMGMGQREGKAAVVSLYRSALAFAEGRRLGTDWDAYREAYRMRVYKLVCHELGHTFLDRGFVHCPDPCCLMSPVESGFRDLDRVRPRFCSRCRTAIGEAVQGPVNTPVTYYHLGWYFEQRGLLRRAREAYGRAVSLEPDFAQAWNNLGATERRLGNAGEAARAYRRAVEASPGYALAHLNLGRLLRRLGRGREALSHLGTCLDLDPSMTAAHRDGGYVLRDLLSEPEKARVWFRRYLEAGGEDEAVRRWLEGEGGED